MRANKRKVKCLCTRIHRIKGYKCVIKDLDLEEEVRIILYSLRVSETQDLLDVELTFNPLYTGDS